MSERQLMIGHAYVATPALEGARRRIVVPIGRVGGRVQLAFVDALEDGAVDARCSGDFGREVVRLVCGDGVYTVSAACELCAADAAIVRDILRHRRSKEVCHDAGGACD